MEPFNEIEKNSYSLKSAMEAESYYADVAEKCVRLEFKIKDTSSDSEIERLKYDLEKLRRQEEVFHAERRLKIIEPFVDDVELKMNSACLKLLMEAEADVASKRAALDIFLREEKEREREAMKRQKEASIELQFEEARLKAKLETSDLSRLNIDDSPMLYKNSAYSSVEDKQSSRPSNDCLKKDEIQSESCDKFDAPKDLFDSSNNSSSSCQVLESHSQALSYDSSGIILPEPSQLDAIVENKVKNTESDDQLSEVFKWQKETICHKEKEQVTDFDITILMDKKWLKEDIKDIGNNSVHQSKDIEMIENPKLLINSLTKEKTMNKTENEILISSNLFLKRGISKDSSQTYIFFKTDNDEELVKIHSFSKQRRISQSSSAKRL